MDNKTNNNAGIGTGTIVLALLLILTLLGLGYYFLSPQRTTTGNTGGGKDDLDKPIDGVDPKADKAVGVLTDPQFFKGLTTLTNNIYNLVQDAKAKKQANQGVAVYPQPQPVGQQQPQYVGPYSHQWYNQA